MIYSAAMRSDPDSTRLLIERFRQAVVEASSAPGFVHRQWYVEHHLEIVHRIALELAEKYPEADRDLVTVLVWLHDYGKAVDLENQYTATVTAGRRKLLEIGFDAGFVETVVAYAELLDRHSETDLSTAPIEVQIVSSADGCAHLVGPFFYLWWWENAERPFGQLMADNRRKLRKDWSRKIVLPEARSAFATRYRLIMEQVGDLPERFLT